jgi:ubiquinol-cytochrome c reductase cytochrome c subunit
VNLGHRGHRSARRSRATQGGRGVGSPIAIVAAWVFALAAAGGAILAFGGAPGPAAADPRLAAVVTGDPAAMYLENCASCHGPQGEGTAAGPSLRNVGAASVDFYLRTGRMPLGAPEQQAVRKEPAFGDDEIRALVDYVAAFGEGPAIPIVRGGGDVGRGYELYTANCAACHAATGAGNVVGGGAAAVGLGEATDVQIAEAVTIGPGVMPPFELSDEDREAVIAYIRFLRESPTPGGAPIGGVGPVAEGFVAVLIGLTGLVLIARFAGSGRTDEAEADE